MAYFINLFSPETYEAFSQSSREVSGFRISQEAAATRIQIGDRFICYMTKLSRWIGVLEVASEWYVDETALFYSENDPFILRVRVIPIVWLEKEYAIPIHDDRVWSRLSFTKNHSKNSYMWTGRLRSSLRQLDDEDGLFLEQLICGQAETGKAYEIDQAQYQRLISHRVRRLDKVVSVSVPENGDAEAEAHSPPQRDVRESIQIQALLASIGATMGMRIWIPRNDRAAVCAEWKSDNQPLLDILPLNYDEATLKTIEQIDVLWLKGRAIVRAFEVEHTTSIYSGILRMADLLALQPNMDIKLHIVAPYIRREKVFQEIRRPVFSLLEKGPLSESCSFVSYDSIRELAQQKHLAHLSDSVLEEYAEEAE